MRRIDSDMVNKESFGVFVLSKKREKCEIGSESGVNKGEIDWEIIL